MSSGSDIDLWRRYRLANCCSRGVSLDLDGVTFDLAHKELDRAAWRPRLLLGVTSGDHIQAPRLTFPWYLSSEIERVNALGKAVIVEPGDTVRLGTITYVPITGELGDLDHPHHLGQLYAQVLVEKVNGQVIPAEPLWQFSGVADVMGPISRRDFGEVRRALLARLGFGLGIDEEDADALVTADSKADWPPIDASAGDLNLLAAALGWEAESENSDTAWMAFGYLVGRAEARDYVFPAAEYQQKMAQSRRERARKRRATGDSTRSAAIDIIRNGQRNIPLPQCTREVAEKLQKNDAAVRKVIADLFTLAADGKMRPDFNAIAEIEAEIRGRKAPRRAEKT